MVSTDVNHESLSRSVQTLEPDIAVISDSLPDGPLNFKSRPEANLGGTPQCPWILLPDRSEPQLVVGAFRAGAKGVFSCTQSDISTYWRSASEGAWKAGYGSTMTTRCICSKH